MAFTPQRPLSGALWRLAQSLQVTPCETFKVHGAPAGESKYQPCYSLKKETLTMMIKDLEVHEDLTSEQCIAVRGGQIVAWPEGYRDPLFHQIPNKFPGEPGIVPF